MFQVEIHLRVKDAGQCVVNEKMIHGEECMPDGSGHLVVLTSGHRMVHFVNH